MERVIDKGARSVPVRDDLIEAVAEAVILDDRLTLRNLMELGNAFADFDPTGMERHSLPVYDDLVGTSSVLRLHADARQVFDVFRGLSLRPDDVPVDVVDRRGPVDETVPAFQQMSYKGFPVRPLIGDPVPATTVRAARDRFDAAVPVGQLVDPLPQFEFDDALADRVELVPGQDFGTSPLAPRDIEEVDAAARAALAAQGDVADENALPVFDPAPDGEQAATVLPARSTRRTLKIRAASFDGRRPDGSRCP